jgi:hypothetical protein
MPFDFISPRIRTPQHSSRVAGALRILCAAGALASIVATASAFASDRTPGKGPSPVNAVREARAGHDVRTVADWVAASHDNGAAPFLIVDKRNATVFVFDAQGRNVAVSPVLLGAARGDDSVPGIGERKISEIQPHERTTPAGRFVAEPGRNVQGEDIVWIDYDAAVSMHRVRANNPRERRLERLATPTAADNRISYGCINVPAAFFDAHVSPIFAAGKQAIVYVLPEVRSLRDVFRSDALGEEPVAVEGDPRPGRAVARSTHLPSTRAQ